MKELRKRGKTLKPIIQIGKTGLTESVIIEIKKQLKAKKKLIKIKFMKGALIEKDRKEIAKEITEKTNSKLIEQIGNVIVLWHSKT